MSGCSWNSACGTSATPGRWGRRSGDGAPPAGHPGAGAAAARARQLAWAANGRHPIEFAIAVAAGLAASSMALVGFGADSLIEALAGFIVIWRFTGLRSEPHRAEAR